MAPQTASTILIVDDEPSVVRGLARLLRHDGSTVDTAANGHLALAHLQAHRYDVVTGDTLGAESTAFLEQCGQPWVYKPCNAAKVRSALQQMLHALEVAV